MGMFTKYREKGRIYKKETDWDSILGVCAVIGVIIFLLAL